MERDYYQGQIPNGNRQRPEDVLWRDFDEEGTAITEEHIKKYSNTKNYKYLQTDGLFNRVLKEK